MICRITNEIEEYITTSLLIEKNKINRSDSLFSSERLDPNFLVHLLLFIETRFKIIFEDNEIDLSGFDTIDLIAGKIEKKLQQ